MNRRSGHLCQNRFYSCPLSASHAAAALRYVDLNPDRASLTERSEAYRSSSAAAYLGIVVWPHGLLDRKAWEELDLQDGWGQYLVANCEEDEQMRLREATSTGRPFGDEDFVLALERKLARPLRPNHPGRPKARAASSNL
jgi:putative transposase